MAVVALDTYEVVKELRAAGFDEAQAAALTSAMRRSQSHHETEIATKADLTTELQAVEARLKADLAVVEAKLHADIARLEAKTTEARADLQRWITQLVVVQSVGLAMAVLGGMAALLRLLQP